VHEVRAARVVAPDGVLAGAAVQVDGDQVTGVTVGAAVRTPGAADGGASHRSGGWLLPGFVDLHCHGGGGADFASTDRAEQEAAAAYHLRHGTTTMLASLVTAPLDRLARQLESLAGLVEDGRTSVVGAHLEGPFLASARRGAHDARYVRAPDAGDLRRLWEASRGTLRVITVAPELPGALEMIAEAVGLGVVVAVGHTDATYEQATAAYRAGARVATHLFNAMRPLHHRDPGAVLASLSAGAACEVIADGIHVHPAVLKLVAGHGHARLVLVTDAISAAGLGDGRTALGELPVEVRGGVARLADGAALAGSTLTMDAALRGAVRRAGLPLPVASRAASATPADILGLGGSVGILAPGHAADLVRLDDDLQVVEVMRRGESVLAG